MKGPGGHVEQLALALREIAGSKGFLALSEVLPRSARALVTSDGATFVLRQGDECYYVTEDAQSPLWTGQRFPMSDCVSGWVMVTGEPAAIPNIYADDRVPVDAYRPTFVTSMVMVPIRASEPLGAIGVYWAETHRPTGREISALRALAEAASLALEAEADLQTV